MMYFTKILLHAAETWARIKKDKSKIQATEIKLLTVIMGKTNSDRIRNAYITAEIRTEDIQNQIKGNKLRWFRHVKRIDKHRIPKRLLEMKMTGKRPRGRP
jgi:nicotinamide mononucleotide adenylyltransferase